MATITSVGDGNWSAAGTWDVRVPLNDDDAVVVHDVTFDAADQVKTVLVKTDGKLILNANLTFTDSSGCGLTIEDDGNFSSNGTAAVPRKILSKGGDTPTYKWAISVEDVVGTDSRTLDFDYVEFEGFKPYLGNDDNSVLFNTGTATDPIISSVTPPASLPRLVEHPIDGRDAGRVYRRGRDARVITISGSCRLDSWVPQQIDDMEKTGKRISLFTRHDHFPKCKLERPSFGRPVGTYLPFSITVREDI